MSESIKILMAQINPNIGGIQANCEKIIQIIISNQASHDLIVFPELALTGYLLEDLLFQAELYTNIDDALQKIQDICQTDCHVIIGHPQKNTDKVYNHASIFANSECKYSYSKQKLPNYSIFDEKRYFQAGMSPAPAFSIKNQQIKLCICEDLWQHDSPELVGEDATDILISINGSPFDDTKQAKRQALCSKFAKHGVSVVYVNQVGGQDELVFDGASFAMDRSSKVKVQAKAFSEDLQTVTITNKQVTGEVTPQPNSTAAIYQAIVLGFKDYVRKNKFEKVLLGLSGGIDSALCLAIAVDALGPSKVTAVLLPSTYTADISNTDAIEMAEKLAVKHIKLAINDTYNCMLETLQPVTNINPNSLTTQNLQARIRGVLLMALSNNTNAMLIATSNKSEAAVGYSTLYGDMNGGYAPIKDVFKTSVYELAKYRNQISKIIPNRTITRAPSAELAPNQVDADNIPDYAILDPILKHYIQDNLTSAEIIGKGYSSEIVTKVINLIKHSEYKRRQAPIGPKVTSRAFGKDWRKPITNNASI